MRGRKYSLYALATVLMSGVLIFFIQEGRWVFVL